MTYEIATTSNGALRDGHWVPHPVTGVYVPTISFDRTSPFVWNSAVSYPTWPSQNLTLVSATSASTTETAPNGSATAIRYQSTTANDNHGVRAQSPFGPTTGDAIACETYLKAGTLTVVEIQISGPLTTITAQFDLTTGTRTSGSTSIRIEPAGGNDPSASASGWYRIYTVGLVATSTSNIVFNCYFVKSGLVTYVGSTADNYYVWTVVNSWALRSMAPIGFQTMYGRNTSDVSYDMLAFELSNLLVPAESTFFLEWVDRGAYPYGLRTFAGIMRVGDDTNAAVNSLKVDQSSTGFTATWETAAGQSTSSITLAPAPGDLVGIHVALSAAGAVTLSGYLNADTAVVGSAGTARALPGAWSDNLMWIAGHSTTTSATDMNVIRAKAVAGSQTLASLRA